LVKSSGDTPVVEALAAAAGFSIISSVLIVIVGLIGEENTGRLYFRWDGA